MRAPECLPGCGDLLLEHLCQVFQVAVLRYSGGEGSHAFAPVEPEIKNIVAQLDQVTELVQRLLFRRD